MSGVGFFSKSINPNPAIPIRYRLPEIVHFKAAEILSTDLIFCQEWIRETHEVRRRANFRFGLVLPVVGRSLPVGMFQIRPSKGLRNDVNINFKFVEIIF